MGILNLFKKNNREVNDLSKIHLLLDGVDPPPEEPDIKLLQKTEIVTVMAFLLALREDLFSRFFEAENPDVVVNFAAESHVDRSIESPEIFLQTNILGTQVLMDACRKITRYF